MMVNKYGLILVAAIINFFIILVLKLPIIGGGLISVGLLTIGYIIYVRLGQIKRYRILEEDLDPEAFIEASQRAYRQAENTREINNLKSLDYAIGYISLGSYERALEFLEGLAPENLGRHKSLILTYYNLLLIVYGKLGRYQEAEKLYREAESLDYKDTRSQARLELIRSNHYLNTGQYSEARKILENYSQSGASKRMNLEILFDLALIDEAEGRLEEAGLKYRQVYDQGHKLYIANLSSEGLARLEERS